MQFYPESSFIEKIEYQSNELSVTIKGNVYNFSISPRAFGSFMAIAAQEGSFGVAFNKLKEAMKTLENNRS